MFNNDSTYARSRISGTYMRHKKTSPSLHYILDVDNSMRVSSSLFGTPWVSPIEDFSFSLGPLGFYNDLEFGAIHLRRLPLRGDWRQGLRCRQLVSLSADALKTRDHAGGYSGLGDRKFGSGLRYIADSIDGKFPSLSEALGAIEEEGRSVALSRNFALTSNYRLVFNNYVIGAIQEDDRLRLNNKFNFLRELLGKQIGHEKLSITNNPR
jgi:hypothetical protein